MTRATILEPMPITDGCDVYKMHATFSPAVVKGSDRETAICSLFETHGLRCLSELAVGEQDSKDGTEITEGWHLVAVPKGNESTLHSMWLHKALLKDQGVKITKVEFIKSLTPNAKPRMSLFMASLRYTPEVRLNDARDRAIDQVFRDLGVRLASRHICSGGKIGRYPEVMGEVDMYFMVPDGLECELYSSELNTALSKYGCAVTKVQFVKGLMSEATPVTENRLTDHHKKQAQEDADSIKKDLVAAVQNEMKETKEMIRQVDDRTVNGQRVSFILLVVLVLFLFVVTFTAVGGVQSSLDRQWNGIQAMNTTMNKMPDNAVYYERVSLGSYVMFGVSILINVVTLFVRT
jgi:hypothetical protein